MGGKRTLELAAFIIIEHAIESPPDEEAAGDCDNDAKKEPRNDPVPRSRIQTNRKQPC